MAVAHPRSLHGGADDHEVALGRELAHGPRRLEPPTAAGGLAVTHSMRFADQLRQERLRRRLSPLELAVRADTSARYVSAVERGRRMPERDMVIRLCKALDLPLRRRNELLKLSGHPAEYRESSRHDTHLRPAFEAIERVLHGYGPFPALVIDRLGYVLGANSALDLFVEDLPAELLRAPVNYFRVALHPDGVARRVGNFASWRHTIIDRVRAESMRTTDPELAELFVELTGYSAGPILAPAAADEFPVPLSYRSRMGELRLLTTTAAFTQVADVLLSELSIEAFLPEDDVTASLLSEFHHRRHRDSTTAMCAVVGR